MFLDQIRAESIVSCGNRCMRGEDHMRGDAPHGFRAIDSLLVHPAAHEFERGKGAMPFVEMHDTRHDAERVERPDAADAEEQLLPNPDAFVASVQPRRKLA